jgi:ribokinase
MIGRVGTDAFAAQMRSSLTSAGVDVTGVATSEGSSGVAVIVVTDNGENSIVVVPGANALLTPQDLDANIEIIRSAGLVLTQLEISLETVEHLAMLCTREGVPLILDPAPARELPSSILKRVMWFTPNETEAAFFAGGSTNKEPEDLSQVARELMTRGVEGVVLKLGARGAFVSANGIDQSIAPFVVNAVDTTAAGDCFNGAFAVGLLMDMPPVEAARFASAAAAISVTRAGAQPSMPTLAEVKSLLAHSSK